MEGLIKVMAKFFQVVHRRLFVMLIVFLAISTLILGSPISNNLLDTESLSTVENVIDATSLDELTTEHVDNSKNSDLDLSPTSLNDGLIDINPPIVTSSIECTSDVPNDDFSEDNIQRRGISPQRARICPSSFRQNPPKPQGGSQQQIPSLGTQRQPPESSKKSETSGNRCASNKENRHIHLTCKGPAIGDSVENADHVLDCVLGAASSIQERYLYKETTNVAQFCCRAFTNTGPRAMWYPGHSCTKITEPPTEPLTLWTREFFSTMIDFIDALITRFRILGEPWVPPF